jgi:hypothetical protein
MLVPSISKDYVSFIFIFKDSKKIGLLDSEEEGRTFLQSVRNY